MTLAETQDLLYLANGSGNRPSHKLSALYFDMAIEECRKAGFRKTPIPIAHKSSDWWIRRQRWPGS